MKPKKAKVLLLAKEEKRIPIPSLNLEPIFCPTFSNGPASAMVTTYLQITSLSGSGLERIDCTSRSNYINWKRENGQ